MLMTPLNEILLKRNFLITAIAFAAWFCNTGVAGMAMPFEAVYEVTIDGKPRLETRISMEKRDEQWLLKSDSKGTRGIARFLNAGSSERSSGHWNNDKFQQLEYRQHSKIAGRNDHWTAHFDWSNGRVTTHHEKGESILSVNAGTTDPLTLTLALREQLERGQAHFFVEVVDEEEIGQYEFRAGKAIELQTSLGCYEVIPLERVRENSKRYSAGWYATSLAYIPVLVRHGKMGGKEYEMRITSLVLNGDAVSVAPDCPS